MTRPTYAQRQRRKQVVQACIDVNGPMCPGWDRMPHLDRDLCADHIVPLAEGG